MAQSPWWLVGDELMVAEFAKNPDRLIFLNSCREEFRPTGAGFQPKIYDQNPPPSTGKTLTGGITAMDNIGGLDS
jgi:hypothetical protein